MSTTAITSRKWGRVFPIIFALAAQFGVAVPAYAQRALGIDVSAWQGNNLNWSALHNTNNRDFAFIRSSRGGTTGFYNQSNPDNDPPTNTLSQRYDDPYFIQNITTATSVGMFAGPYHFSRPDVVASTTNSNGIPNNGTDEANHFMQMAGPWMRPGYLLPVHDFEAGDGVRSDNELAQFCLDFSNRINAVMGIRPAIYVNGNYAANILQAATNPTNSQTVAAYPTLWSARWPNQPDPDSIDVQNAHPKDSISYIYGPWDNFGVTHPWAFWQYASTARLSGYNNGNSNIDVDVAQGDIEFVKDYLVPALWMNDGSGDWNTLLNWNSGQTPVAPVQGPGQVARVGPMTLPNPRLPGVDDTPRNVQGENDTVILDRPNANITVTHSSGTHSIRKLIMRESLDITGGSLTIGYDPNYASDPGYPNALRSGPISAQFSGPVSLSGSGSLNFHTLQVDATRTFTLGGGTLTFDTINLMPHSSNPGKIAVTGQVNINALNNVTATIANGSGSGSSGRIELAGGAFNVGNGSAAVDLSVDVPMINGALTKDGLGTMRLGATNTYSGQTTVNGGILLATANNQLGSTGVVTGQAGTLQLSGNLSYSLPLSIGGAGVNGASVTAPGNPGALDNLSGDNTWSGPVTLIGAGTGGTDPLLNQIGSQAGTLRLSGAIQNGVGVDAAWAKTGNADVILSGIGANTYTGLTRLSGGRLIVEKDGALGAAGAIDSATGNTFQLAVSASTLAFRAPVASGGYDYSTFEVINTHGTGAPGLGQVDNLGGDNTFAGQIAFDGPDSGGKRLASIGVSGGSLHVAGGLYARGNDGAPRQITKLGAGTLILSGDGGVATGNALVAPLASSTFNVDAGTVELRGPSPTTANLPGVTTWNVNNGGALSVASGHFSTNLLKVNAGGQFTLAGGSAALATLNLAGGTFNFTGGELHASTVQGNLTNQGGALSPGNSAGLTNILGNYTQQSGAALVIEIGGSSPASGHDFVLLNGSGTLDGSLDVSLINDFTPLPGQQFTVLAGNSLVNNGLTLGGPAAGLFNLIVGANSLVLEAISAGLAGDFNNDGSVDVADYVVWRRGLGTIYTQDDYVDWQTNFGQTAGSGSGSASLGAVPEPTSLGLLAVALLHFVCARRLRPRQC